jgi:hypothetical protein
LHKVPKRSTSKRMVIEYNILKNESSIAAARLLHTSNVDFVICIIKAYYHKSIKKTVKTSHLKLSKTSCIVTAIRRYKWSQL